MEPRLGSAPTPRTPCISFLLPTRAYGRTVENLIFAPKPQCTKWMREALPDYAPTTRLALGSGKENALEAPATSVRLSPRSLVALGLPQRAQRVAEDDSLPANKREAQVETLGEITPCEVSGAHVVRTGTAGQ